MNNKMVYFCNDCGHKSLYERLSINYKTMTIKVTFSCSICNYERSRTYDLSGRRISVNNGRFSFKKAI